MPALLLLRPLTDEETAELRRLAQSQKVEARLRERARICWRSHEGQSAREIMAALHLDGRTVRRWIQRFNAQGLAGLTDAPRQGRTDHVHPPGGGNGHRHQPDTAGSIWGLPFGSWTLDRWSPTSRRPTGSRCSGAGSGRSCRRKGCAGARRKRGLASGSIPPSPKKGGDRHALRDPTGRQRRDLSGRDGPGECQEPSWTRLVRADPTGQRRNRATQEIDYGRRGKGYVFGAFEPATGEAFTAPMRDGPSPTGSTSSIRWTPGSIPPAERVYAILDNLSTHRAMDVLLWSLTHPRWEFVFQPTYAAYLNLIEPWWKISAVSRSRDDGSRPGTTSGRRSSGRRRTGTPTGIPSSGATASAVVPRVRPASGTLPAIA